MSEQSPTSTDTAELGSMTSVTVLATATEGDVDGATRYTFSLSAATGTSRTFIIDVPHSDVNSTDVWVSDSTVEVGDTPLDGFATFSPANTTDEAYRQHHDGITVSTDAQD